MSTETATAQYSLRIVRDISIMQLKYIQLLSVHQWIVHDDLLLLQLTI